MSKTDTIIFDLDGTLLDTLGDLADSVNFALSSNALPERTYGEIRSFVGNGIRNLIDRSVPKGTEETLVDKVFADFKARYKTHCKVKTRPYDGINELLEKLSKDGYKMSIVSNKADSAVQDLHKEFFYPAIETAFGEMEGIPRKPNPQIINYVLEKMGSKAENTVYIGDSEVDFTTAENAGLKLIMVSWGFRDREALEALGVSCIADDMDKLYAYIRLQC